MARYTGLMMRSLLNGKMHDIDLVIDRLDVSDHSRLVEACEQAAARSEGLIIITCEDGSDRTYSSKMACPVCGITFEELQPRMFSFNSPFGACPDCKGLGIRMDFDPELIIPEKEKSMAEGAIAACGIFLTDIVPNLSEPLRNILDFQSTLP